MKQRLYEVATYNALHVNFRLNLFRWRLVSFFFSLLLATQLIQAQLLTSGRFFALKLSCHRHHLCVLILSFDFNGVWRQETPHRDINFRRL